MKSCREAPGPADSAAPPRLRAPHARRRPRDPRPARGAPRRAAARPPRSPRPPPTARGAASQPPRSAAQPPPALPASRRRAPALTDELAGELGALLGHAGGAARRGCSAARRPSAEPGEHEIRGAGEEGRPCACVCARRRREGGNSPPAPSAPRDRPGGREGHFQGRNRPRPAPRREGGRESGRPPPRGSLLPPLAGPSAPPASPPPGPGGGGAGSGAGALTPVRPAHLARAARPRPPGASLSRSHGARPRQGSAIRAGPSFPPAPALRRGSAATGAICRRPAVPADPTLLRVRAAPRPRFAGGFPLSILSRMGLRLSGGGLCSCPCGVCVVLQPSRALPPCNSPL